MKNALPEKASSVTSSAFDRQRVLGLGGVIAIVAFSVLSVWFVTVTTMSANTNSQLPSGDLVWGKVLLTDAFILVICGLLCAGPVVQLYTKFTDEGIEQPSFPRATSIHWRDVQAIRNIASANVEIIGSDKKIYLNPRLFKDAHKLIAEIHSRIPEAAFPTETQVRKEITHAKQNRTGFASIGAFGLAIVLAIWKNNFAVFSLCLLTYGLYEAQKWVKMKRGK